ncbi:MAG: hypothetical protein GY895_02395 [Phycisphaera sp.]|nr:hypothetical protein [Phycisphaera sp.]
MSVPWLRRQWGLLSESGEPTGADAETAFDASRVVLDIDFGASDAWDRHLVCDPTEEYVRADLEYGTGSSLNPDPEPGLRSGEFIRSPQGVAGQSRATHQPD